MLVPKIGSRGRYQVGAPFTLDTDVYYTTLQVETYAMADSKDGNVFNDVYVANGLSSVEYNSDLTAQAVLITLVSEEGESVKIPSTYLSAMPDISDIPYSTTIVAVDLGDIANDTDLTLATDTMAEVILARTGINVTTEVYRTPVNVPVSIAVHESILADRASRVTENDTYYAKYQQLLLDHADVVSKFNALKAHIESLQV